MLDQPARQSSEMTKLQTVGVIGAGAMGNGIAHVCALGGHDVAIVDLSDDILEKAIERIGHNMDRQVAKGLITESERDAGMKRLTTSTSYDIFAETDLVIEAATEDESVDLQEPLPLSEAGSNDRDEHLVDLDHPAGGRDRSSGPVHGDAFHEPGSADEAGGTDPRYCDGRRNLQCGAQADR